MNSDRPKYLFILKIEPKFFLSYIVSFLSARAKASASSSLIGLGRAGAGTEQLAFYVIKRIISFLSARSIIAHHSFFTLGFLRGSLGVP